MATATARIGETRYATTITTGSHTLTADEPEKLNGADAGPAPFDLLLTALGACTAITLKMYAEHKAWPLEALDVRLHYHGGETPPRIERELVPRGPLSAEQRTRLADVAERTPVTLAIKGGVPISTTLAEA